jgi:hypothetical protein
MQKSEYSLVKEEAFWHSFVFIPSLQLMNKCLSPFSVAVTKYLRLVDRQRIVDLTYSSGDCEVQGHGAGIW